MKAHRTRGKPRALDPRQCRSCGHIRIAKDGDGREIAGGAHVDNTGLCWFCWLETPEGSERKAEAEQREQLRLVEPERNIWETACKGSVAFSGVAV